MMARYKANFDDRLPDIAEVIAYLERETGLMEWKYNNGILSHPVFKRAVDIYYVQEKCEIWIEAFNGPKLKYIELMVLKVLYNLGADNKVSLPEWVNKKWDELSEKERKKLR